MSKQPQMSPEQGAEPSPGSHIPTRTLHLLPSGGGGAVLAVDLG